MNDLAMNKRRPARTLTPADIGRDSSSTVVHARGAAHDALDTLLDLFEPVIRGADDPLRDRLLSVKEAARALHIGRTLLYRELRAGHIRSLKVGRRRLIPSSAIGERAAVVAL